MLMNPRNTTQPLENLQKVQNRRNNIAHNWRNPTRTTTSTHTPRKNRPQNVHAMRHTLPTN